MFKWYGLIGIVMIVLAELNFIFKIEPFASKYFIIIWLGYILTIDAIVFRLRKRSLLMNNPYKLGGLFLLSAVFWWIFEFVNLQLGNWNYNGTNGAAIFTNLGWKTIYFSI